jgi:predicted nucleic acid-binding protein
MPKTVPKVSCDTSFLVAALLPNHPHHARAYPWFAAVKSGTLAAMVSVHALAELFSVLTRLPLDPPIRPAQAEQMIGRLRPFLTVIEENEPIVTAAVARCAAIGAVSGAVYDAIHVVTAEAGGADRFLTFNERHFRRLAIPSTPQMGLPAILLKAPGAGRMSA